MKKGSEPDELRPEYDFSQLTGGVRGKYVAAYRRGTKLIRLDPDVAKTLTTDESVKERSVGHGLRRRSGEELTEE